jgi:DNA-binding transcriptional ArsR family regulator
MARATGNAVLETISDPERALALLRPLRLAVLRLAREPISATEIGTRLGLPRQRINYHVRELARAGFLRKAGRRRRGNMVEQQYVATSRGWGLSPELLGGLGADWRRVEDTESAAFLFSLAAQMQADLARAMRSASGAGTATVSLKSQFRFESAARQRDFERALRQAVIDVIARHTAPNLRPDGRPGPGRPFRLVLGLYPYVAEEPAGEPARDRE